MEASTVKKTSRFRAARSAPPKTTGTHEPGREPGRRRLANPPRPMSDLHPSTRSDRTDRLAIQGSREGAERLLSLVRSISRSACSMSVTIQW